ncbi:MAG: hypothetical protein QY322_03945 [bacterium]|nr:MAG: hypothetical protein QY322_03945 [bacterium]
MTTEVKTTDKLISDAEDALPLAHADRSTAVKEAPVLITPVKSVSGGFQMTEEEKQKAEADARHKVFGR